MLVFRQVRQIMQLARKSTDTWMPVSDMLDASQDVLSSIGCNNEIVKCLMEMIGVLSLTNSSRAVIRLELINKINEHFGENINNIILVNDYVDGLELDNGVFLDLDNKHTYKHPHLVMLLLISTMVKREYVLSTLVQGDFEGNSVIMEKIEPILLSELLIRTYLGKRLGCMYSCDTRTMLKSIYTSLYRDNGICGLPRIST